MKVQVQQGDEAWTAEIQGGGPLPSVARDVPGSGAPVTVTRSLHVWDLPTEWRHKLGQGPGLFTVEAWMLRFEAETALAALTHVMALADEIEREVTRIGWGRAVAGMTLAGEALLVGGQGYVASLVLAALTRIPSAAPPVEDLAGALGDTDPVVFLLQTLRDPDPVLVPCFLRTAPAVPRSVTKFYPTSTFVVRKDGGVVELDEAGACVHVHLLLPPARWEVSDSHPSHFPASFFCPTCNAPHPDRKTCP